MKKIIFTLLTVCFMFNITKAQDTIVKKNGEIISTKILEVGNEEVKFTFYGVTNGPIITLKKSELKKIRTNGLTIFEEKTESKEKGDDIIIKKNGEVLNVKVQEIGVSEVKFKLQGDSEGPVITIEKSEIKNMTVRGLTVIDVKGITKNDIIIKKDGSSVQVKIIDLGADVVSYKLANNPDGPNISIKKSEIDVVKIDGQVVYKYAQDPRSISNNAILNKNSCLKFYFFSPLNKHLAFGYEWMQKPGFNWEAGIGIVGLGKSLLDDFITRSPSGAFLRFGPKFLLGSSSDIEIEGAKYAHPLKGKYIKIEMILSALKIKSTVDTAYGFLNTNNRKDNYTNKYQSLSLNVGYGRQFILGNTITIGYYLGVGYSFETKTTDLVKTPQSYFYEDQLARYSHTYFGENFPLMTTCRFTIGYIFDSSTFFNKKNSSKAPSRHSMTE